MLHYYCIMKQKLLRAFTLVELLIVIALIAILSVAVLATINPIEQANKARDSRVQNDGAEILNAYERYYASKQKYPWEEFADAILPNAAIVLRSDTYGFGICSDEATLADLIADNAVAPATDCNSGAYTNFLIQTSELKSSFSGKDEFDPVIAGALTQAMWVAKRTNGDSLYVCYVPKAKANRDDTAKMRCVGNDGVIYKVGDGACAAVADEADWAADPASFIVAAPDTAVFKCIPE